MSTYTPNYQLHQWEPEDHFLRSDFNQDFSRIDTAIQGVKTAGETAVASARTELNAAISSAQSTAASKCQVYVGTYGGNGGTQQINLGFRPLAVLVEDSRGIRPDNGYAYGGLATRNRDLTASTGKTALSISATGFSVYSGDGVCTNISGMGYVYLAFR